MANYIVGAIEMPAFVIVYQGFHLATCAHAREAPVVPLAHDQAALQVECRTVSPDGVPDEFWRLSGRQLKKLVLAKIHEMPIPVGMS